MSELMARAAAPFAEIIRGVGPDRLGAQTPCAAYDVRRLVNHLLFWGPSLEGAGRKEAVPPPGDNDRDVDLTSGNWQDIGQALEAQLNRTVTAWSTPAAWEGMTRMGGPMELPAPLVGGMVVGELVVHGWDLATATGQSAEWDEDLLEYLYEETAKNAAQGREIGIYGPEVPVPESAPPLHRVLGLTGRDPEWGRSRNV